MSEPHIRPNTPNDGSTMAIGAAPRPAGQIEIAAPLESGSRIGPYEVRQHVGDGGMAAVYKVWHTGLHRFEALKIPRYQASRGPEADFLHRLLAEARTAAGLQHPHIVAIHNVSDEKSVLHYFAMEFVNGCDLASLIENGPLPFDEALAILQQVGSALDYAHAHGVVHRDVKPANILLEKTATGWHAKVVDFGISRAGEDSGSTRLTRSGMIVGTPEYMSPEQSGSGADVDYRTDIYSLGVVAYEMLCGQPPFTASDGVSRISVLMKHIGEAPQPLAACRPDLPEASSQAVMRALSKNPDERFASCAEFLSALAAIPPLREQEAALLKRTRRAPQTTALPAEGTERTTKVGTALPTALFTLPSPEKIRAVTSRASLLLGLGGLLTGAVIVWNNREPEKTTPIAPKVEAKAPEVEAKAPEVEAKAPEVEAKAPEVVAKTPKVKAKSTKVAAKSTKVETKAASATKKTPKVTKKAPKVRLATTKARPTARRLVRKVRSAPRTTLRKRAATRVVRRSTGGEAALPP
jgi:serine/threonine protein kinase